MRADRPLLGAVVSLGWGLGLILGYCKGTTGFSAAYPLAGSMLHLDITTTGPAVLGGVALVALGVVLLVWAFIAAIVSLFTGTDRTVEHVVERYSVVPEGGSVHPETAAHAEQRHFWSRPSARTHL